MAAKVPEEEWRKSIRESVEKTIKEQVESRLDTPPLERMRRRQEEARLRKLQQLRELELSLSVAHQTKSQHLSEEWRRKFGSNSSVTVDCAALDKLDKNDRYRAPSTAPPANTDESCTVIVKITKRIRKSEQSDSESKNDTPLDDANAGTLRGNCHSSSDSDATDSLYQQKRELFHKFSKEGLKEAIRKGLVSGTNCRGRFRDANGIELSTAGPFWPSGYGPLVPTPEHVDVNTSSPEPLSYAAGELSAENGRRSEDISMYEKWTRKPSLVFDVDCLNAPPLLPETEGRLAPSLRFESRFESGNLAAAYRVGQFDYELFIRPDLFTERHTQWFYFRVTHMLPHITYNFKIVNLSKSDSLYNCGMRPLMYSDLAAASGRAGWARVGHHISYTTNTEVKTAPIRVKSMRFAVLSWSVEFKKREDTCYFAHCYPYTFSRLRDFADYLSERTTTSRIYKKEVLCETRARNTCYLLTITNFDISERVKKGVVVTGRVHPGESNSSWMMHGFLQFLTSQHPTAMMLRERFVFKVVPMLNPDGVIVGNYRCSLFGRDLNRNYRKPNKSYFPTIHHTKLMIQRLAHRLDVVLYVDMHGHSRKQNVFMYGCDSSYRSSPAAAAAPNQDSPDDSLEAGGGGDAEHLLNERLFPFLMSLKVPDKFSFKSCKFNIRKCKESTGRVVMFRQFNILNSFTMETTFAGTTLNGAHRHFTIEDYKSVGRGLCDALLDYSKAMEDESAQTRYIVELTRVVTNGFLLSKIPSLNSPMGCDESSWDGQASDEQSAKLQKLRDEIAEQLTRSKNLNDCFRLLDSLRFAGSNIGRINDTESTDDSDSGSESEMPTVAAPSRKPAKRRAAPKKRLSTRKDRGEAKAESTAAAAPDWRSFSNSWKTAAAREVATSDSASETTRVWKRPQRPQRRGVGASTAPVPSRLGLAAIAAPPTLKPYNPYQGRSGGGLPIFTSERIKDKREKKREELSALKQWHGERDSSPPPPPPGFPVFYRQHSAPVRLARSPHRPLGTFPGWAAGHPSRQACPTTDQSDAALGPGAEPAPDAQNVRQHGAHRLLPVL